MNLDEAIKHCNEKAEEQRSKAVRYLNGGYSDQIDGKSCLNCAREHEQLVEWLTDYKRLKALEEQEPTGEWKITDSYPHKVYCTNCFKTYAQANWEVWKDGTLARGFCPNCGAKMEEEGKKERDAYWDEAMKWHDKLDGGRE